MRPTGLLLTQTLHKGFNGHRCVRNRVLVVQSRTEVCSRNNQDVLIQALPYCADAGARGIEAIATAISL